MVIIAMVITMETTMETIMVHQITKTKILQNMIQILQIQNYQMQEQNKE